MTDLTQRPLMPIGVNPRATAQPPDAEHLRDTPDTPVATNAGTEGEPGFDRPAATAAAAQAPATTVTPEVGSLDAAIEVLARDAAALREAVARFEIAGRPADTAQPDDAPLLDALAREQRVRDDTVELTRGLARITTQSALLLVKFTDSAAAFLQRFAAANEAASPAQPRSLALWVAAAVGLAGIAAVVGALALLQGRDQSIGDNAQVQAAAASALETRVRELASREAAITAAIQAATAVLRAAEQEAAAQREPAKPAASSRNTKRKAVR